MKQIDEIAGEVYPSEDGPCNNYLEDGRSDRCLSCDWREREHISIKV